MLVPRKTKIVRRLRRTKGKKRPPAAQSTSLRMAGVPFPLKIAAWLPFAADIPIAGAPLVNVDFLANSAYHVNGANSVYNFSLLGNVYHQFLVDKARFTFTVSNSTASVGVWAIIYPDDNGSTLGPTAASQQKGAIQMVLAPVSGSPSVLTRTIDVDFRKFFGLQMNTATTSFVGSYAGVSPSHTLYVRFVASTLDGTTNISGQLVVSAFLHVVSFDVADAAP